jgi:MFS family permease
MIAVSSLVEIGSKPVLSPMGDYFDKRNVLVVCFSMTTVLAMIIGLLVAYTPFSAVTLGSILVGMALVAALRDPVSAALVPSLVSPSQMTRAQSLRSSSATIAMLGGSALAGWMVSMWGSGAAMLSGVVCALVALILVTTIRCDLQAKSFDWYTYSRTWKTRAMDGLMAVWHCKAERGMSMTSAILNSAMFPLTALVIPLWVLSDLGAKPITVAAVEISLGIGMVFGSTLGVAQLNARFGKLLAMKAGITAIGLSLCLGSFATSPAQAMSWVFLAGAGFAVYMVNSSTLRAAATPGHFRARMIGGVMLVQCAAYPLITQLIGTGIEFTGPAYGVFACGLVATLALWPLGANRDVKRLLAQTDEELVGAYGRLYPEAFKDRP